MTQDVGATPRNKLTPTQRLKLFEKEKGICCLCGKKIRGAFIDEHKRALGLGGSNDPANRGVAHPKCADVKTRNEDMPRINKAKAQKKAHHGIKRPAARPMQSRNDFPQAPTKSAITGKTKIAKLPLPRGPTQIERLYVLRKPTRGKR